MRRVNLSFDEVNSLSRSEYEEYFDEMGIDEDAKEDRVLMAMFLEDRFLEIFSKIEMSILNGVPYFMDSFSLFEEAYVIASCLYQGVTEDMVRQRATDFALAVATSTYDNEGEPYFLSADRAVNMAATESNGINIFGENNDAKLFGKTKKTWHTIIDGNEREWHEEVNGVTVPIDEPFEVGGELMNYPLDTSLGAGAANIANCRCWVTYS